MSALFEKKPCAPLLVFFLLLLVDRLFVLAQDDVTLSNASTLALDDSRFAKNMDELPEDLRNKGNIGFTEDGNLTLTLLKSDDDPVCIPLMAVDSSSNFSFRASLNNCTMDEDEKRKWNLTYLGEEGEQGKLIIIWTLENFKLVDTMSGGKAYVGAEPKEKDEVDVLFDKSQAFVGRTNGPEIDYEKGVLNLTVPVDMQAMENGTFSLSLSHVAGSDKNCSITLEFNGTAFGLLKSTTTTTMTKTPAPLTIETPPDKNIGVMWYIFAGVAFLLLICIVGIWIWVCCLRLRREKKEECLTGVTTPAASSIDSKLINEKSVVAEGNTEMKATAPNKESEMNNKAAVEKKSMEEKVESASKNKL